jgi:hypothetical protein
MKAVVKKSKKILIDWTLCKNGKRHNGSVIAAVNDQEISLNKFLLEF